MSKVAAVSRWLSRLPWPRRAQVAIVAFGLVVSVCLAVVPSIARWLIVLAAAFGTALGSVLAGR